VVEQMIGLIIGMTTPILVILFIEGFLWSMTPKKKEKKNGYYSGNASNHTH